MPSNAWSAKRERQFEHIKDGLEKRGNRRAEEIAARTVNKERAQHGESVHSSKSSTHVTPPSVRGGQHSHTGAQGLTRAQLYDEARRKGIKGRSAMNKAQLKAAIKG